MFKMTEIGEVSQDLAKVNGVFVCVMYFHSVKKLPITFSLTHITNVFS